MDATPTELGAVPLFASLSEPELAEIACWFDAKDVGEGTRLVGEGASGYTFFVLADGSAAVTAGGEDVGTLGPGDFFGEIALLGHGRRTATVTTTTSVRVFVLFRDDFHHLQTTFPAVAADIDAAMKDRFGRP